VLTSAGRRRGKRLTHDLEYRLELGYCVEHGIPRSAFLGRPRPGPGEPVWLDRDRDEVVGFLLWRERTEAEHAATEARLCTECHTAPEDWPKGFADPPRWEVEVVECIGCLTIAQAWAALAGHDTDATAGMHMRLRPFDADDEGGVDEFVELTAAKRLDADRRNAEKRAIDEAKLQTQEW
jgi:hypothetical protein